MAERLDDIGYVLLFLYSFGGGFVGLATAAVLASLGKMSLLLSIALAGTANLIGSTVIFYFARNSKADAAAFLKKHRRKLALVHLLMKKRGSWVIFIQKFIYGIKTLVPLAAGITKYDASKFITLNILASYVWAIVIGVAAYFSGSIILQGVYFIEDYPFMAPVILVSILGGIYFYMSKTTKKEKKI